MFEFLWLGLAAICLLVGFLGCILPILPGPPISFLALICVSFARDWQAYTTAELSALGAAAVAVTVLDFVVPVWGAKRYGASRTGVWLSVVGMIVGFFFFPPFGLIAGVFLGAFFGELMSGKGDRDALRAAFGTVMGTLLGVGLKLACSGVIAWYCVTEAW